MDGDGIANTDLTQSILPLTDLKPIKKPFTFSRRAQGESHQDPEAQGSHEPSSNVNQTNRMSPFTENFKRDIRATVEDNAKTIAASGSAKHVDQEWIDTTAKHLQDKYVGRQHSEAQATKNSLTIKGSITYLARTPGDVTGDEDDVQCRCYALSLENPTQIRRSLVTAQNEWDKDMEQKVGNSNRLIAIRWIHLPANNGHWVEAAMPSIIATCRTTHGDIASNQVDEDEMADRIFQDEFWRNQRRERPDNRGFSRTMEPFAAYIDGRSRGYRARSPRPSVNVLVAFMPYLHWESSIAATYMRHVIRDVQGQDLDLRKTTEASSANRSMCQDEVLLREYLSSDNSNIHPRRTLDQFYYPTMRETDRRDNDQVVERYALGGHFDENTDFEKEPPILMVDQCWVWAIGSTTVLTAFPRTYDCHDGCKDPIDLHTTILKNILKESMHYRYLRSSCHFARFVIRVSSINLLQPLKQICEHHKYLLYFEHALGILREKKIHNLRRLLQHFKESNYDTDWIEVFQMEREYEMLEEVQDIIEELQMIQELVYLQQETMRQFEQNQRRFLKHAHDIKDNQSRREERGTLLDRPSTKAREKNVNRLLGDAKDLKADIRQQLRLKQQQISMFEAKFTRSLYQENTRQGETILLFTVVTIVFLPLSTLAAVFGINSSNFGSGSLPLGTIFAYIFPISFVCVALSLFLGFRETAPAFCSRFVPSWFKNKYRHFFKPNGLQSFKHQAHNADRQRRSTHHHEPRADPTGSRERYVTSTVTYRPTSEQVVSNPYTGDHRPKSTRWRVRSRTQKSHKEVGAEEPQQGELWDDVAMYSFSSSSDSDSPDNNSTQTDDGQAESETSL